jgi:hypothetical protein
VLERGGWIVVRAAGSLGCCDLMALKDGETPLMVGVKSSAKPFEHFGPRRRVELSQLAELAGATAWLAHWPSRGELRWLAAREWPEPPGSTPEPGLETLPDATQAWGFDVTPMRGDGPADGRPVHETTIPAPQPGERTSADVSKYYIASRMAAQSR